MILMLIHPTFIQAFAWTYFGIGGAPISSIGSVAKLKNGSGLAKVKLRRKTAMMGCARGNGTHPR